MEAVSVEPASLRHAREWLAAHERAAAELSDRIWQLAEPGLCEVESAAVLCDFLAHHGFRVSTGQSGIPSSFIAEWGHDGPNIGLVCEYDATPGEGQAQVPYPRAEPGRSAGFTDLHNGIGAASAAAAVAASEALRRAGLRGRLSVFGTPAEKLCVGKPLMARDGYFDDLDAVVAWHPRKYSSVEWKDGPGVQQGTVYTFSGKTAYAARPWDGVDALDAVVMTDVILRFLRDRLPREMRASVSRVITRGGLHPTSIPGDSQIWYIQRAADLDGIRHVSGLVTRAAESAAHATGASFTASVVSATRPWLPNDVMTRAAYLNLQRAGAPSFPPECRDFAGQVLDNLGRDRLDEPLDETLTPPEDRPSRDFAGGADDINELCWHAPTARIYIAHGLSAPALPNWARSAFTGTSAAHATVAAAAKAVAFTVLNLLEDADLLEAAREEHTRRVAETGHVPPLLPEDSAPPVAAVGAPPFLLEHLARRSTVDVDAVLGAPL